MVVRLDSDYAMERFLWLLYPGFAFELVNPRVSIGGLGIHAEYHLRVGRESQFRDTVAIFPPFPFDILTSTQLGSVNVPDRHILFGILIFLISLVRF